MILFLPDMEKLVWFFTIMLSCFWTLSLKRESTKTCFKSSSNMLLLMKTEEKLVNEMKVMLEKHKHENSHLLLPIKKYIDEHDRIASIGKNTSEIIQHPIDAYRIIADIIFGWESITSVCEENMDCPTGFLDALTRIRRTCNYPDLNDLNVLGMAIARLQHSYQLNVKDMLHGTIIDPVSQITYQGIYQLNAWDCTVIGMAAREGGLQAVGVNWMIAAKELIVSGDTSMALTHFEELLHMVTESASDMSEREENPGNQHILQQFHNKMIQQFQERIQLGKESYLSLLHSYRSNKDTILQEDMVCRGQRRRHAHMDWSFHCHYETHGDLYLVMGPFKVEQISADPPVYIVHDIIYDSEIRKIQKIAIPNMKDSEGYSKDRTGSAIPNIGFRRSSQHFFVYMADDPVVTRLLRRLGAAFKLYFPFTINWGLKVIDYGIGGHYATHIDAVKTRNPLSPDVIDGHFATILLYLNDVEAGGATVFPVSGVTVRPKRGMAAFWFNVDKAGETEHVSYHAGCPVLYGSKWVTSVLPFTNDQMFTRKCGLNRLDTYYL